MSKKPRKFSLRWRGRRWYDPNWNSAIFSIIVIIYLLLILDTINLSELFKK